jgi:hypothetical protein
MAYVFEFKKKRVVDTITKDELIEYIHKSGCKMLKKLHLEPMTKEHIIKYLEKAECPSIKILLKNNSN